MQLPKSGSRRWRSRTNGPRPIEVARKRSLLLRALIILLFGVLSIQLVRMQILQHEEFDARAESNRLRTIPELPARGLIYDRYGELLVENLPIFSAAVVPADVPELQFLAVVAGLSEITGVSTDEIAHALEEAQRSGDPFTPLVIKEDIDAETAFLLRERQPELPGAQVLVESIRSYPYEALVSHLLGFVGRIDEQEYAELRSRGYLLNDHLGKAGVEYIHEAMLRGSPGYRQVEIDAAGEEINTIRNVAPRSAGNLVLSLDLDLQRQVEQYLIEAKGNSLNAVAVVIDVNTGGILSMVSLPSYDNNVLTDPVDQEALPALYDNPAKPMVNHAISEVYPPGSTFKQVTGTAALQEGVASPDTTITSRGLITVEDEYDPNRTWVMRDWAVLGTMDFYRGLAMSSDVYFYYLSGGFYQGGQEIFEGLGVERLAAYARQYGLGSLTGIDLPGEATGSVPDAAWKIDTFGEDAVWTLGDTYNFGIGQGFLTVTPMQLLLVTAAIANGGDVLVPHVLQDVVDEQGNILQHVQREVSNTLNISQRNLGIMQEALRQAADYGPARTGASKFVTIGGKTGTAEFGQPLADGTYPQSHAWYTAYAPFEDPEIAVVVFLEQGIGATNAGPVAKNIFDYYFDRQRLVESTR
ncbi:MAG: penicillin-binding protein 2 [Chloroflexi bacterium]|nr:penicillin-binding protein 2 [Chloroflexota bacterium]MCI0889496.1 penicillin-binding protein 2 [Chloroflexota bacterium]